MMQKFAIALFFTLLFFAGSVWAQEIPVLEFFYGRECPHCHKEKAWLPTLQAMYPDLEIKEYEVWHDEKNKILWAERLAELDQTPRAVPTNIIKGQVIVGFQKETILEVMRSHFGEPLAVEASPMGLETPEKSQDWTKWIFIFVGTLVIIGGALALGGRKN